VSSLPAPSVWRATRASLPVTAAHWQPAPARAQQRRQHVLAAGETDGCNQGPCTPARRRAHAPAPPPPCLQAGGVWAGAGAV
jgi:hypothetical protein